MFRLSAYVSKAYIPNDLLQLITIIQEHNLHQFKELVFLVTD